MNTYPFPYTKPPYIQICLRFFFSFGKGANRFGCQVNLANLNTRVTVSSAEMMTGPRAAGSLSLDYNAAERGFTVPKAHTMQHWRDAFSIHCLLLNFWIFVLV